MSQKKENNQNNYKRFICSLIFIYLQRILPSPHHVNFVIVNEVTMLQKSPVIKQYLTECDDSLRFHLSSTNPTSVHARFSRRHVAMATCLEGRQYLLMLCLVFECCFFTQHKHFNFLSTSQQHHLTSLYFVKCLAAKLNPQTLLLGTQFKGLVKKTNSHTAFYAQYYYYNILKH